MKNTSGQIQTAKNLKSFNGFMALPKTQNYIASVMGSNKEIFVTSLISTVANNKDLQACEESSILFTAMKAAALRLPIDPNLGFAAIIAYNDKKTGKKLAQLQIMRDGWVELLQRTGQLKSIANEVVYEGELVRQNRFTGEYIFDENNRKSDKIVGYMAYAKLTTGFEKTVYWPVEKCDAHAKQFSQTYRSNDPKVKASSMWTTDFNGMAKKTVLKHLIKKYMPKSVELQKAIQADQATYESENAEPNYVDGVDEQDVVAENVEKLISGQKDAMRKARNQNNGVQEIEAEGPAQITESEQQDMVGGGRTFDDMP